MNTKYISPQTSVGIKSVMELQKYAWVSSWASIYSEAHGHKLCILSINKLLFGMVKFTGVLKEQFRSTW